MSLKPSTAINPPPPGPPDETHNHDDPTAATLSCHSPPPASPPSPQSPVSEGAGEHTTSNFNLGRRYRPTPLPTPAVESDGAPQPAFPLPGGLAMTTPAAEARPSRLDDPPFSASAAPKDELATKHGEDTSSSSSNHSGEDDDDSDRGGSNLIRRTTGKGFKVKPSHQDKDKDSERQLAASGKIESSRQKARAAKVEEDQLKASSSSGEPSTTDLLGPTPPAPLVKPSPAHTPPPPQVDSRTPTPSPPPSLSSAEVQDERETGEETGEAGAVGTPEHERPHKDYKRGMTEHLKVGSLFHFSFLAFVPFSRTWTDIIGLLGWQSMMHSFNKTKLDDDKARTNGH